VKKLQCIEKAGVRLKKVSSYIIFKELLLKTLSFSLSSV
jgi:hypothetical protein